ncbi:hypothetical protein PybrP1_011761 [[Pythium] brassicae (nom. inval.)]|nr:hypothetical protein PybrP1_011761 [[Pythium] brassicae (nom. inval.)]
MSDADKPASPLPLLDVEKFARFSGSTFKADKFYKTIGYGAGSLGHLLSLAARADSDTSTGLKKISSSIGMARFVVRFTGGFESYEAWKNGSWCYGDDDAFTRRLVSLQALSMLVYYPMEHLSYIGFVYVSRGICVCLCGNSEKDLLKIDADKISRQSCVAWTVYVVLDIYANYLRIKALTAKEKVLARQSGLTDEERQSALAVIRSRKRELYFVQLRNACFFPTCLHWSLEKGLIPESAVQFLCFTESVIGIWRSWTNSS